MVSNAVVDSHLHVWRKANDAEFHPHPDHPPPENIQGDEDFLLSEMEKAGVQTAVLVQPIVYKFDHAYIGSLIKSNPARFVGMALANTSSGPGVVQQQMEALVADGFRGVRVNPNLLPEGETLSGPTTQAVLNTAAKLNIPVAMFVQPVHFQDLKAVLTISAGANVIIDHFGFCRPDGDDDHFQILLNILEQFPNTFLKTSAFFRCSNEPYPYKDMYPWMNVLVDKIGADRMMWGSDFPWVLKQCGYKEAFDFAASIPGLSEEDRGKILRGTSSTRGCPCVSP
eukprot:CAMPEP_0184752432 /NCGR_PEP_ID=MMETSP0315-20130426/43574_1 /TAXON_ID=101924 /ORGANISM="Rhodosorus marinus, Strain UTEX LB 2760" /LENGTH=282 /DNA_ID=CAMNT_0027231761 /DNA_START=71 /DNA_END=919 /DNA_ORIENTATION=+